MTKNINEKTKHPQAHQEHAPEKKQAPAPNQAVEPAPENPPAGPQPAAAAQAPAAAPRLADEAEAFCADLERFFRRAFGSLPKSADVSELRAQQATVRDLLRRTAEASGENSAQLAALMEERNQLKETAQRARADFLNYQARATKDLDRAEELALRRYLQDLLPVLDSLKLALRDAAAPQTDAQRLKDALSLIDTSLNQALAVRGLEHINAVGQPFDPNLHEAVALRPADPAKGEKPNQVLEELRAGYLWKGLVLRPAQVLITTPPTKKEAPA